MRDQQEKQLAGHRAVVTGASSGIGQDFARQLAAMGADLVIAARRLDRLEALAQELRDQHSVEVQCVQVDLCEAAAPKALFEQATTGGKEVTLLINNAGLGKYGSFMEFPFQNHRETIQVNAMAPTEITYYFVEHMLQHQKKSYITQVASIAAYQPVGNFAAYSATKGFMRYFSETLAFELKKTNVSMTCVCPGGTYTEFFEHSGQKITSSGHATMMTSDEVVRLAIQAMLKEKTVFVPGLLNKLACFFPRLLPSSVGLFLAHKTMSRAVERSQP